MEAKIFSSTPEGLKVHWQVDADSVGALTASVAELLAYLADNEDVGQFGPDNGFGTQPAPRPAAVPAPGATAVAAPVLPMPPPVAQPMAQAPMPPQQAQPPRVNADAVLAVAEWVWYGEQKHCSLHGPAVFRQGGVSQKTGLPYNGFWKCTVVGCKPVGAN